MDRVPLTANAERVLRLLVDRGSMKVKEMAPVLKVAEATVHRMAKTLSEHDLITTELDGIKVATPAGKQWLTIREEEFEVEPRLPIDALAHAPSLRHRIGMELGLCGVVARKYAVSDRSLPSLLIIGRWGTFKTTLGEAIVALAGAGKVVLASAPSGRDLLLRRDSRGVEVTRCELLNELVVVLDEVDKVKDANIKHAIEQVYLHGTSTIPMPDTIIDVKATTVAVMNPRSREVADFVSRTGADGSLARRLVVIDLWGWKRPDEREGETFWLTRLVEADTTRVEKLPPPRNPTLDVAVRFKKTLRLIVRGEAVLDPSSVDCTMWSNMAAAATAWFKQDEEAFRFVVWAWARLAAPRRLLLADWEVRLKTHFAPKKTAAEVARKKRESDVAQLVAIVDGQLGGDMVLARALLESKPSRELRRRVREELGRDFTFAGRLVGFGAWLRKNKVSIETVQALAGYAASLDIGEYPEGAKYLLALGNLEYDLGKRLHAPPSRNNPAWPDPFAPDKKS
jgi:hypothetical protein